MTFTIDNDPISDGQVLGTISFGYSTKKKQRRLVSPEVKQMQQQMVSSVTPEYRYEDARRFKYKVFSTVNESWEEDLAAGAKTKDKGWLRDLGKFEYYEMSSIRQLQSFPYKLKESTSRVKITMLNDSSYIDPANFEFSPIRLNLSISDSDTANQCYRLYRKNANLSKPLSLGFHAPDSNIEFSYLGGDEIGLTGLEAQTHYRLSWHCYSGAKISFNGSQLKKTRPATGESISSPGSSFPKISLIKDQSLEFHGADLWLEKKVDQSKPARYSLWAFVRAAEVFHYENQYYCKNCSFLDCFDKNIFNLSL